MIRLISGLSVAVGAITAGIAAASETPADPVVTIIRLDKDGRADSLLPDKPDAFMRGTFTAAFNKAWANALSHNKDEAVLDGDPITGQQNITKVALKSTKAFISGDIAQVVAEVLVTGVGSTTAYPQPISFSLKRESGTWKIDDITDLNLPSIRTYFHKSYGQ